MSQWIRNIFLCAAGLILFGHSVVPHLHHDEFEDQAIHQEAGEDSNILDLLVHIFHFSSGERHLEDFRSNNGLSLTFLLPQSFELPIVSEIVQKQNFYCPTVDFQNHFTTTKALRGPPSYS